MNAELEELAIKAAAGTRSPSEAAHAVIDALEHQSDVWALCAECGKPIFHSCAAALPSEGEK